MEDDKQKMVKTLETGMYISPLKNAIRQEIESAWSVPYLDGFEYGIKRRKDLSGQEKKDYYSLIRERRLKMISR